MFRRWLIRLLDAFRSPRPPAPTPDPIPAPPVLPPAPAPTTAELVATAINAARASSDLPPLAYDARLSDVSQSWARLMASAGTLDHGAFGARVWSVYPNTAAGEDIAEGQSSPSDVVAAWMDDPPHRANILGGFNRLGVGLARDGDGTAYWVADFVQQD